MKLHKFQELSTGLYAFVLADQPKDAIRLLAAKLSPEVMQGVEYQRWRELSDCTACVLRCDILPF